MKHNNALSTGHFRKTSLRYKTWFGQAIRRKIRKEKREEKAKLIQPMNVKLLRPIVRCNTRRYNMKERLGRGFSFAEITAAGLTDIKARELGIAVDPRRYNYSEEGVERNVERIKEYLSKTKVYNSVKEAKEAGSVQYKGTILPLQKKAPVIESIPLSEVDSTPRACNQINTLRNECIRKRAKKERMGILKEFPVTQ